MSADEANPLNGQDSNGTEKNHYEQREADIRERFTPTVVVPKRVIEDAKRRQKQFRAEHPERATHVDDELLDRILSDHMEDIELVDESGESLEP